MRNTIVLLFSIASLLAGPANADQTASGAAVGTFTGTTSDNATNFSGNIEGQWLVTISTTPSGSSSAAVTGSGTFGAQGISGTWQVVGYDPATMTIRVSWSAPGNRGPVSSGGNGAADGGVNLVLDPATGKATGAFSGQVYIGGANKTVSGTWVVTFQSAAIAGVRGNVNGSFSGTATAVGNISGAATGTWVASLQSDGSVTGSASGTFNGGNVAVPPYGNVCICGTWVGTLARSTQGVFSFQGSWTQPVVSGSASGAGGGPMSWVLDTSTTPFNASGSFSGSTTFTVMGFSIPISASGNWSATLPLTP
ncbi:MAG: hypothetical protein NT159_01880 [Proteobacteria bacterium]|nr:hypothetical protein [Pseudomonadota bacterium]